MTDNGIIILEGLGKVNYWLNDSPKIHNYNYKIYKFNKFYNNKYIPLNKKINIVLEIFLCRDASNYALLGLEYEYLKENSLNIEILYTKENNFNYESNLLTQYFNEYLYCGLNKEYLNCIIKSINDFIDYKTLKIGGKLKFNVAVNSEVGSSNNIFYFISQILLSTVYDLLHINLTSKELIKCIIEKKLNQNLKNL